MTGTPAGGGRCCVAVHVGFIAGCAAPRPKCHSFPALSARARSEQALYHSKQPKLRVLRASSCSAGCSSGSTCPPCSHKVQLGQLRLAHGLSAHRAGLEGGQRLEPAPVAGRVAAARLVWRLHGCFAAHSTGRACRSGLPSAATASWLGPAAACWCCWALQRRHRR